jgi:hypothetical protein
MVTNNYSVASIVNSAVVARLKQAKKAIAAIEHAAEKIAAHVEKQSGMNVPEVPPANDFEAIVDAMQAANDATEEATAVSPLSVKEKETIEISAEQEVKEVKAQAAMFVAEIRSQLAKVAPLAIGPLTRAATALRNKPPMLDKITSMPLGCLYAPTSCDESQIRAFKISFCFTNIGCSNPTHFGGMADLGGLIHSHAKATTVKWLRSILVQQDITLAMPSFVGGELTTEPLPLRVPSAVNETVLEAFTAAKEGQVSASSIGDTRDSPMSEQAMENQMRKNMP